MEEPNLLSFSLQASQGLHSCSHSSCLLLSQCFRIILSALDYFFGLRETHPVTVPWNECRKPGPALWKGLGDLGKWE